jgi:hypothetical protein
MGVKRQFFCRKEALAKKEGVDLGVETWSLRGFQDDPLVARGGGGRRSLPRGRERGHAGARALPKKRGGTLRARLFGVV